jgi:hypothetical protein
MHPDRQSEDPQERKGEKSIWVVIGTCLLVCFFYPPTAIVAPFVFLGYFIFRGVTK